ncbi:MAG: sigma-70 family RNA polymerase sigma factor [Lachnospiraceae bacterium]|nr:sigma-70 family RNA polymerase sigma factor [Lachnospiraceae bacterium]
MDKQKADKLIEEYFQKIYGFAVRKSYSSEEAEELSAEMVKEVYLSFIGSAEIANPDGYVWRICSNVFSKHVNSKKKQAVSIDGMEIPYYADFDLSEREEELAKLRKEIAFLSTSRRKILLAFYYEGKSISKISAETGLPEGTVKWHLNKARNDLKEGFKMERKIGNLGIAPVEAISISHNGRPENDGGPEKYLGDSLNLNIVYSVYEAPKTKEEIAEELGMTPVFINEKIDWLEENGFLVRTTGNRYMTYVLFYPRKISLERHDNILREKVRVVRELVKRYVPKVRKAIEDYDNVYIPDGNRELFEAAMIFYAISNKCTLPIKTDVSKYYIKTPGGADYAVSVQLKGEIEDPDYTPLAKPAHDDYNACGDMYRDSKKYKSLNSWSCDTRLCSRQGRWQNNKAEDYEALYEWICGSLTTGPENEEKFRRLHDRGFISKDGKVMVMVVKEEMQKFFDRIPELDKEIKDEIAGFAMEQAVESAKSYPKHMQDYQIYRFFNGFITPSEALMAVDELYDSGVFNPLTEEERVTSQLLVFSDRLPG